MNETRMRTYGTAAEQQRDEADARADGWWVKRREPWDRGTWRVTYERGRRRRIGPAEVAIAVLAVATLLWLVSAYYRP